MRSATNKQEWNDAAAVYAAEKAAYASGTAGGGPDRLCCPLLPSDVAGLRILDAGCGTGPVSRYLAERGATVVAVDVSDELIDRGQAAEEAHPLGITYLVHDLLEELPFEDGAFDAAVAVMVVMDVEDPLAAVRHIGRVVRPGGQFVFSLVHPCFYRPKVNTAGNGFDLATYFDRDRIEGRYIERNGTRADYRQFHRTLGDYLNTLADCGFCLVQFHEPGDSQLAISCRKQAR
jgi:SAM-dependent methyltransferase